jgi:hypothetical protein
VKNLKINILGTEYELIIANETEDPRLEGVDGYCDTTTRVCVVDDMACAGAYAKANLPDYQKKVKRHELLHAFLYESGLAENSWANNEEAVDWIAIQFDKLKKAFEEADCL